MNQVRFAFGKENIQTKYYSNCYWNSANFPTFIKQHNNYN